MSSFMIFRMPSAIVPMAIRVPKMAKTAIIPWSVESRETERIQDVKDTI